MARRGWLRQAGKLLNGEIGHANFVLLIGDGSFVCQAAVNAPFGTDKRIVGPPSGQVGNLTGEANGVIRRTDGETDGTPCS